MPSIKHRNEGEEHHYSRTESRTLRVTCRGARFSGRKRLRSQKEKRKRAQIHGKTIGPEL